MADIRIPGFIVEKSQTYPGLDQACAMLGKFFQTFPDVDRQTKAKVILLTYLMEEITDFTEVKSEDLQQLLVLANQFANRVVERGHNDPELGEMFKKAGIKYRHEERKKLK